ncbi:U3 small nucleolar ribonucleoprotein protein MPP10 [Oryza brachyantha]|uniref:U3 small nucleolar ribonucleoprotein protein MPP10 n=1 Tax=Oryza brachyantha TaxID=4533 RepID=J3NB69_ORYBR|nr:U3 small nucleolar ribonucleoprotein protein MPP10 [Oryza brachyantha]
MAMDLDEPFDADKGEAALRRLRDADPALYLSPSADLAAAAREASKHLYASLVPFSPAQPPPLSNLLAGPAFDAEQIWSQIELLSRPLVPHLRRQLRRLEQQPPSQAPPRPESKPIDSEEESSEEEEGEDGEGDELELDDVDDEDESGEEEEEEVEEEHEGKAKHGVEDKFFSIKEMKEFVEKGEEEEYGAGAKQGKKKKRKNWMEEESDEEDEEDLDEDEDDGDEEDDERLDLEDFDDDEEEEGAVGDIMYKHFFEEGSDQKVKKKGGSKKVQFQDEPHEKLEVDDKNDVGIDEEALSTHEKACLKMRAKIEDIEKANLEPSTWTMQGEVNASSRPKNSALEVDLDFEHNVRPAPVITEEVTASLEEMIKKRIIEGHFDDVEKPPPLPSKAPKEHKELDESKSKKGLAELYEDDYAQKAGLAAAPLSISDELKKEANALFKRICLKLDALSHFHFAPKPVIEDMSIQANVPALAMEEIAPVAVSDAAMLAPEEIFEGKGDVKEDAELTQAERKRRRANKKRRYAESHKERPAKVQKD